jgi:glycosyltransferase involved in cell wall biosynthesis
MAHWPIGSFIIDGRFVQDHFPGIGRYTFNLIRALAEVAPDQAFTIWYNPALRNTRYDLMALAGSPNIRLERMDVHTFSLQEQWRLPARLHECRAALYHSPYYIMPYRPGIPSVVTVYDLIPFRYPHDFSPSQRLVFNLTIRLAVRAACRVIAISQATAKDLVQLLRVPLGKIDVIPLAADPIFQPPPAYEVARVREKYKLPASYVLSVGINKPHKNQRTLVEAWQRTKGEAGALVMAGAWDARYSVVQDGVETEGVLFIPNIPESDLPALYAGARVFVMPSLYEGFGLPILEAMACGAPVIAAKTSSLPEVAGDAALFFDPKDANALAEQILQVVRSGALEEELRAKSLARAAEFSWTHTARETLRVYERVGKQGNK